jgi:glutamine cyclotransferase
MRFHRCLDVTLSLLLTACSTDLLRTAAKEPTADISSYAVPTKVDLFAIHPHNVSAFTEGFFFMDGTIVESTGLAGRSFIRQYHLSNPSELKATISITSEDTKNGNGDASTVVLAVTEPPKPLVMNQVLNEYQFDSSIFGEGIATIGDKLYALTYKQNKVLVLSKTDFTLLSTHPLHTSTGEGWGMTTDGTLLIVSDGSSSIQFYDPQRNFKRVKSINVTLPDTHEAVPEINELEYIDGEILANVWFKNYILRIDATDGHVIERLDLSWIQAMVPNIRTMPDQHMRNEAVMNGIAFNPKNRHVYITGKLWDSIFELDLSYLKRHASHHHRNGV